MNQPFSPPTTYVADMHAAEAGQLTDAPSAFTAADFARMVGLGAFEGLRVELVGGTLEKMSPASLDHGARHVTLTTKLATAFTALPVTLAIDLAVQIDETTVRAPDLAIVRSNAPGTGLIVAAQVLLAVEIAETTLARDLVAKASEYARGGINDYWVVDNKARFVHIFSRIEQGIYSERRIARFDEPIDVPGTDRTITIE